MVLRATSSATCRASSEDWSRGRLAPSLKRLVAESARSVAASPNLETWSSRDRVRLMASLTASRVSSVASPELNQQPVFETTNVPVLWANLVGGDHILTGLDGAADYRSITLAWFRLQLMGDDTYRPMFHAPECSVCSDSTWEVQPEGGL